MTEDEVKAVVRGELDGVLPNDVVTRAEVDAIASRVAAQLAGLVGLSEGERDVIEAAKVWRDNTADNSGSYLGASDNLAHERALVLAVDRLLGGKP